MRRGIRHGLVHWFRIYELWNQNVKRQCILLVACGRFSTHRSTTSLSSAFCTALSDPVRVAIFAKIASSDCPQICSEFLKVAEHPVPKSTLSQHFKILREAGLIRSERRGIEMHNTTRCAELESRFPGLTTAIVKAHAAQSAARRETHGKRPAAK
ncbi:MAG: helix-turn-helix domain-containing protein [Tepidisphaeraceae bacterium]